MPAPRTEDDENNLRNPLGEDDEDGGDSNEDNAHFELDGREATNTSEASDSETLDVPITMKELSQKVNELAEVSNGMDQNREEAVV